MYKVSCKHKNIYHEMKKRLPDVEVSLDVSQESLIHMEDGSQKLFNVGLEVLEALGYTSPPTTTEWVDCEYKKQTETCYINSTYLK